MTTRFLLHSLESEGSTSFVNAIDGAAVPVSGNIIHSDSFAKFGQTSIWFDGGDNTDKLTLSTTIFNTYMAAGPNTIDCWVYFPSYIAGKWCPIAGRGGGGSQDQALWVNSGTGAVGYSTNISVSGGTKSYWTASGLITRDTWHHIEFSMDGSHWRIFVDGIKQGEWADTSFWKIQSQTPSLGYHISHSTAYDTTFHGYMDEIRITDKAEHLTDFTPEIAPYFGAAVQGIVRDRYGNPASRAVCIYARDTGHLIGRVVSDPLTGEYSYAVPAQGEYAAVCFTDDAAEGQIFNDQIYRVIPN
jgi:hypothetical protein